MRRTKFKPGYTTEGQQSENIQGTNRAKQALAGWRLMPYKSLLRATLHVIYNEAGLQHSLDV